MAAAERFAAAELPSAEEEVWRYSRIGDLDLDALTVQPSRGDPAISTWRKPKGFWDPLPKVLQENWHTAGGVAASPRADRRTMVEPGGVEPPTS